MKKLFGIFVVLMFSVMPVFSASKTEWTAQNGVNRVNKIGKAILTSNNLPSKINFKVIETDEVNAYANGNSEIYVYTGLLKFVDNDAELAGVISHEIGHILNNHVAKQSIANTVSSTAIAVANMSSGARLTAQVANELTMLKVSRSEEYEADITGVDLMTKAGYNPLAMVSVLYKISGNFVDFVQTHPSGDKRTMYIYDYITYTYPQKAKAGYSTESYKQFSAYSAPIVAKRNANPAKLKAFNKKQEKLKKKRAAKMEKYKNKSTSGWQNSYEVLKALTYVE